MSFIITDYPERYYETNTAREKPNDSDSAVAPSQIAKRAEKRSANVIRYKITPKTAAQKCKRSNTKDAPMTPKVKRQHSAH